MNIKRRIPMVLLVFLPVLLVYGTIAPAEGEEEAVDHGGDIIYTKPLKAVIFSHKAHTEDIGLHCEWCHESTFEMQALAMQEQADNNMESLCNEKYCGTCHNGDISFSTTTQCARCHIGMAGYNELVRQGKVVAEKTLPTATAAASSQKDTEEPEGALVGNLPGEDERPVASTAMDKMVGAGYIPENITLKAREGKSPVLFNHRTHTERERQRCTECHPKIFKMKIISGFGEKNKLPIKEMEKGKYCGVCHNGKKAFSVTSAENCGRCHSTN